MIIINLYKIATKYKYIDEKEVVKRGDIFKIELDEDYEIIDDMDIEGDEIHLEHLAQIYIAVDDMIYNISNQWEDGMDVNEFLVELRELMYRRVG